MMVATPAYLLDVRRYGRWEGDLLHVDVPPQQRAVRHPGWARRLAILPAVLQVSLLTTSCGSTRTPDQWALHACQEFTSVGFGDPYLDAKLREQRMHAAVHAVDRAASSRRWAKLRANIDAAEAAERRTHYGSASLPGLVGAGRAQTIASQCRAAGEAP